MMKEFPEESYLEANPDVKEAVENGQFRMVSITMMHLAKTRTGKD